MHSHKIGCPTLRGFRSVGITVASGDFEVKELSVPVSRAQDLKKFYRIIASDERNTEILKPSKQ